MTTQQSGLNAQVGHAVDVYLKARYKRRSDLAAHLKLADVTLRQKIKGVRPWHFSEVVASAEFLHVSLDDLLGEPAERVKRGLPRRDSDSEPAVFGYKELHGWDLQAVA